MNDIFELSRFIVNYSARKKNPVSPMQLQNILYFLYGFFWNTLRVSCFEADFVAGPYGPMNPEIFRKYAIYGASPIPSEIQFDLDSFPLHQKEEVKKYLDILLRISKYHLMDFSKETVPWINFYKEGERNHIPVDAIQEYFQIPLQHAAAI